MPAQTAPANGPASPGHLIPPPPGSLGWPYTLSPHDSGFAIHDCWPAMFFGIERVDEMRRKVESLAWARRALDTMLREAEQVLTAEPIQPIDRAGSRHDFFSRTSGESLVYDSASPHRFLDPRTGRYETLPEQHRAWVLLTHERTHRLMRSLGFLYALTGDERYAEWVAEGMRRAVEFFRHGELRNEQYWGALLFHPLYDAPALMMLCDAYMLTRNSRAYSSADHEAIIADVFSAGIRPLLGFLDQASVHNITCYVAAAVARLGYHLDRADWLERGLRDARVGLRAELTRGVPADESGHIDGFWFEGTMFYHFYALCPLTCLMELDRMTGGGAWQDPGTRSRFEEMFAAPISLADEHLRLPTIGDLGAPKVLRLHLYRHLYEYAAGQLSVDRFAPTLAAVYQAGIPRNSLAALAFGPDDLPEPRLPSGHTYLHRHGVAIMRAPGGWHVLFRCGPHGAGHDHPDRLEIAITAHGRIIAPDPGTAGYELKAIHPYYRSTFSHNTVFVDEADQAPSSAAHMLWLPNARPAYARGTLPDAYEDVLLTRHVWLDPPYLILMDVCTSENNHRYGWLFHAYGTMCWRTRRPAAGQPMPPVPILETYLQSPETVWVDGQVQVNWRVDEDVYLRLLATSDGRFQATFGRTPGNPMLDDMGAVVLRAAGKRRCFWTVLEVHRSTPSVAGIEPGQSGLSLVLADGTSRSYHTCED